MFSSCSDICAQNFYKTMIFDGFIQDTTFHRLELEKGLLVEHSHIYRDSLLSCSNSVYRETIVRHAMIDMQNGNVKEIKTFLESDTGKIVLSDCEVSGIEILDITDRIKKINKEEANVKSLYRKIENRKTLSDCFSRFKMSRLYDVEDGQKIFEIGAGNLFFAELLAYDKKDLTYFLNDIDPLVLKGMYIALHRSNLTNNTSNNIYRIVQGTAISTGAEGELFDKIIIRKAFHHFDQKEVMLEAIKESMHFNTDLILEEVYEDDKKNKTNRCDQLMKESEIISTMLESGFRLYKKGQVKYRKHRNWVTVWRLAI